MLCCFSVSFSVAFRWLFGAEKPLQDKALMHFYGVKTKSEGVYLIYGQVSSACISMLRKNKGHYLTYGQAGGSRVEC